MEVTLLYFDNCPNWKSTDRILKRLAAEFDFNLTHHQVTTHEEAARVGFRGSPTILIDGADPFGDPDGPTGLSCRVYTTPEGLDGSRANRCFDTDSPDRSPTDSGSSEC